MNDQQKEKELRDRFALGALVGLLPQGFDHPLDAAYLAYKYADAMLRARKD